MPKIVVLDGHTLNPGDLSWSGLEAMGDCAFHARSDAGEVVGRATGAEVLLTNKVPLDAGTIAALPDLKYIGVTATGGIAVTNVPAYGSESVAQMVLAHMLNLTQRVADHAVTVTAGRWAQSPDFCYWDYPLIELNGLTLGIVGYGAIGAAVAQRARAFGMNVLATTRSPKAAEGVSFVALEALLERSDFVTLHCPLTPETDRLINTDRIAIMKDGAFLINTGRGQLVDEPALAAALASGKIAGAGLDVLSTEPPAQDNPLVGAPNCFVTPHIAWATRAARDRLLGTAVDNLAAYFRGEALNVVN